MARSFSTATLTVKLQEGIILGGQDRGSMNSFSITGIKNVVDAVSKVTKKPCNFGKRKDTLNRLFPYNN